RAALLWPSPMSEDLTDDRVLNSHRYLPIKNSAELLPAAEKGHPSPWPLHREASGLRLANVGDRISGNGSGARVYVCTPRPGVMACHWAAGTGIFLVPDNSAAV